LDLTALNRVLEHARDDLTVTVEAGIELRALAAMLRERGQWFPPALASRPGATLGGLIAADRRGLLTASFGSVRDYLLAVVTLDGDGKPVRAGARVVKSVAGYDFMKLHTGALGQLGPIVEATLRLRALGGTWASVRTGAPPNLRLLVEGPRRWFPAGLFRWRGNGSSETRVVFQGNPERVKAQVRRARAFWGESSEVVGADPTLAWIADRAARLEDPDRERVWGGALPADLVRLGDTLWPPGEVVADLLRGHFWFSPEETASIDALARTLAQAGGHLNRDAPRGAPPGLDAWGWVPGNEAVRWRRIKEALDPKGVWVAGRWPGGV